MVGNFHPSAMVDEIYGIMDSYETEGMDLYNAGLCDALIDFMTQSGKEYQLACSDWPNEEGGVCALSFIDGGFAQLVMFDYKY